MQIQQKTKKQNISTLKNLPSLLWNMHQTLNNDNFTNNILTSNYLISYRISTEKKKIKFEFEKKQKQM